jgi:plastocyanin
LRTVSALAIASLTGLIFVTVAASAMPPQVQIMIESGSPYFLPTTATVLPGVGIRWDNPTATYHTITYDGCASGQRCLFDSGSIPPDGSYLLPGLSPGRYSYHCRLHPIMRGVVHVLDANSPGLN